MNFPQELADLRQWICWRLEPDPRGEKPRKVPYDPRTGRKASSTNPETWATLPEAMRAQTKYLFTGVGFVFTEAGGIVGVDIDHCRNEDGTFTEAAQAILDKYPSYTEISPSGAGLHIFYRGVMPGKGNKNSATGVEMYASARYFTMTGNRLEGTPEAIADGAQALPWIHENYIARKQARKRKAKKAARRVVLTDEQVLEKARAAQNAEDFTALWEGRWQEKFASQSEADLALCCALAFWTGCDREQMDRLFRQSALFREKWDKVHHADGATYGEETLEQAIARTENVYSPGGELGVFEANGRYMRERGENVYPLTNFVVHPLEMLVAEEEAQMTCDAATMYGETFRLTFMTADFAGGERVSHSRNVHRMEDTVARLIEAERALDREIDAFLDVKQEIRQTIALVADADCRLLLELRYLSMKRWEDIAGEMQMCRTSVYLLHRRALDMVETILRTREECARHDAQ